MNQSINTDSKNSKEPQQKYISTKVLNVLYLQVQCNQHQKKSTYFLYFTNTYAIYKYWIKIL